MIRVVLDTSTVVSALLFDKGRLRWLLSAWRDGSLIPLVSRATVEELLRVLEYPKFQLSREEREELLGDFLPYAEVVQSGDDPAGGLPQCRDGADQKFLELAAQAQADALVSGDADLIAVKDACTFPIITPAELRGRLVPSRG